LAVPFPPLISGGLIEAGPQLGSDRRTGVFPPLISGGLIEAAFANCSAQALSAFPPLISGGLIEARRGCAEESARRDFRR